MRSFFKKAYEQLFENSNEPFRIALLVQKKNLRLELEEILTPHYDCLPYSNVSTMEAKLDRNAKGCLLFHLNSHQGNRSDIMKQLGQDYPRFSIFVLSDTPHFKEGSVLLQLGAKGYANSMIAPAALFQAIELIRTGNVWLYPEFNQQLINTLAEVTEQSENEKLKKKLSAREYEIAQCVALGKNNKEIAEELGITERTVKAHLTSIFAKVKVKDRLSLAVQFNKNN